MNRASPEDAAPFGYEYVRTRYQIHQFAFSQLHYKHKSTNLSRLHVPDTAASRTWQYDRALVLYEIQSKTRLWIRARRLCLSKDKPKTLRYDKNQGPCRDINIIANRNDAVLHDKNYCAVSSKYRLLVALTHTSMYVPPVM